MAIEITAAAKKKTGIDLSMFTIIEYPAIGDLCKALGGAIGATETIYSAPSSHTSTSPPSLSEEVISDEIKSGQKKQQTFFLPPKARVILLHGCPKPGQTPLYMIVDGYSTITSYIHLPSFNTKTAIYVVNSPFIRGPEQMNAQGSIGEAAKLIDDAVIASRPQGALHIGSLSGGGMIGYEVSCQLGDLGSGSLSRWPTDHQHLPTTHQDRNEFCQSPD
ncbi:beta-ketoacyl synthase domain-containing protein [Colletotrichum chrysophilum]|uniref:Beta-ketoacyl synthase domain-containing protein n=1 Tax=Colletotrichum chrysophilum TaxID=1836956 RepID=A0AAD9EE37_9PEZI|nr:hypothetical protein K456DRAFT_1731955 [Colletotrichum gloeosporioides 23]KAK1845265.1 beta-ketoacyl synthase domain-containing protein [Colletotrichum chrysophilum]